MILSNEFRDILGNIYWRLNIIDYTMFSMTCRHLYKLMPRLGISTYSLADTNSRPKEFYERLSVIMCKFKDPAEFYYSNLSIVSINLLVLDINFDSTESGVYDNYLHLYGSKHKNLKYIFAGKWPIKSLKTGLIFYHNLLEEYCPNRKYEYIQYINNNKIATEYYSDGHKYNNIKFAQNIDIAEYSNISGISANTLLMLKNDSRSILNTKKAQFIFRKKVIIDICKKYNARDNRI